MTYLGVLSNSLTVTKRYRVLNEDGTTDGEEKRREKQSGEEKKKKKRGRTYHIVLWVLVLLQRLLASLLQTFSHLPCLVPTRSSQEPE